MPLEAVQAVDSSHSPEDTKFAGRATVHHQQQREGIRYKMSHLQSER